MLLSMLTVVDHHRRDLAHLRKARLAVTDNSGIACRAMSHGEEINFVMALGGQAPLKAALAAILDTRIATVVRDLEAHGITVDE